MMMNRNVVLSICVLVINLPVFARQSKTEEKPKFGYLQCRADAQKWTYDPSGKQLDPKYLTGAAVMVNGQFRVLPHLSYGVTVGTLVQRIYEMSICTKEDAEFEKQFAMYSTIEQSYTEERTFRYMNFLTKHNLDKQFVKEDAEDFK